MSTFEIVDIKDSRLAAQLERIGPNARAALEHALAPLAARVGSDARSRAAAHIHTETATRGGRVRFWKGFGGDGNVAFYDAGPGGYLASIKDGMASKESRVVGWVRSAHPLAHLLEYGANPPPHDIVPDVAGVLAFEGDAGTVYAKIVHHPGAKIPPYPAIYPAFEHARGEIAATLHTVLSQARL